jgi:tetratricopeptide (TPR) repeat protein
MGTGYGTGEHTRQPATPTRASRTRWPVALLAAVIALAVLAAFAPAVRNEFINYDDDVNLVRNTRAQQGVTLAGLRWAFTTAQSKNWHPLTWLSHMIDFSLFGAWAGGHHAMSVLIHAANAALLFAVLRAMTGAVWRNALVAALFGLHPLRVESVAWAAERKDVLTLLFGLLALGAYLRYARRRTAASYAAALVLCAAALMSKAMLVTFPALLLLLDFWPLNRWSRGPSVPFFPGRRLLLEKAPFLAAAVAVSLATFLIQQSGGAVGYLVQFPLRQRIGNAFCSYVGYLGKTAWPTKLAVIYPYYWEEVPWWQPVFGGAFVAAVTIAALLALRRRPAWIVGWSWYLGTLLPVIGIVQVGSQSMADRYTYVPQIGVLLLVAWGLGSLAEGRPQARAAILVAAPLVLAALAGATWAQVTRWRTSVTLFTHAAQVTEKNFIAYSHLGSALLDLGRTEEGSEYIARAYRLAPTYRAVILDASGDYYVEQGLARAAAEQYRKALAIVPFNRLIRKKLDALGDLAGTPTSAPLPDPHRDSYNRGNLLVGSGRREEAAAAYREAIRSLPEDYEAWHNLGCVLHELGRADEAVAALEEALCLKPDHPSARRNLEIVRSRGRRKD